MGGFWGSKTGSLISAPREMIPNPDELEEFAGCWWTANVSDE